MKKKFNDTRPRHDNRRPLADTRRPPADTGRPPAKTPDRSTTQATMFGVLPVLEALRASARRIDKILVAEGVREKRLEEIFDLARANGIRVDRVSREVLERTVDPTANHQGIVAFAAAADYVAVDNLLDG